jgi:hypothetical protein
MSELVCDIQSTPNDMQFILCEREVYSFDPTEGYIEVNGRPYSGPYPVHCILTLRQREKEPYKTDEYTLYYNYARYEVYDIEIYRVDPIEDTSTFDEVEDSDGIKMNICWMSTERQKIWFRILKTYDT